MIDWSVLLGFLTGALLVGVLLAAPVLWAVRRFSKPSTSTWGSTRFTRFGLIVFLLPVPVAIVLLAFFGQEGTGFEKWQHDNRIIIATSVVYFVICKVAARIWKFPPLMQTKQANPSNRQDTDLDPLK